MGKTKIQVIDDSAPVEEKKGKSSKKKLEMDAKSETVRATEPVILSPKDEGSLANASTTETSSEILRSAQNDKVKKSQKPGKAKPRSKKYQEISKDLDRSKYYPLVEAVDMVKKLSYAKFNATLEAHINTHALGLRGFVSLPFASGKKLKILAFPPTKLNSSDKKELEDEGVVFGNDSTIEEIITGKVAFDLLITTPDWMPKLAKAAKVLGPKGLMPNPKNGTIASGEDGLKKAVESFQAGKTEYKTEPKAPVIHLALGKLTQPNDELSSNIKTIFNTLGKSKIKKLTLSPTMGPSVKIDLASI